MRHILDIKNLRNLEIEHELAFAGGRGVNKHLYVKVVHFKDVYFQVISHEIEVYFGRSLQSAVDTYNNAEVRE